MRVLALAGSNRKHGNTIRIVGLIEAGMRALAAPRGAAFEFETLALGELARPGLHVLHAASWPSGEGRAGAAGRADLFSVSYVGVALFRRRLENGTRTSAE